jgi:hypothetical protein
LSHPTRAALAEGRSSDDNKKPMGDHGKAFCAGTAESYGMIASKRRRALRPLALALLTVAALLIWHHAPVSLAADPRAPVGTAKNAEWSREAPPALLVRRGRRLSRA